MIIEILLQFCANSNVDDFCTTEEMQYIEGPIIDSFDQCHEAGLAFLQEMLSDGRIDERQADQATWLCRRAE